MATTEGTNTYNRQNWEDSDFPLLCQTCLGDNPYLQMMKEKHGKECKTCNRPFTVFRWCPGARMRFKKTEVCQTCSQMKNICQTCLLDLEYGLPVQVRDAALRVQDSLPKSDVNKEFHMQQIEREIENNDGTNPVGAIANKSQAPRDMLLKVARTSPYYKRNRPHICSFWVKGECKRGEECPYRHDRPTDPEDPLADIADKLLRRYHDMPKLEPPDDKTITTLYVGGLGDNKVNEEDLKNHFYQFGEIRSINVVQKWKYGFVQFTNRSSAETAAEKTVNRLIIKGQRLSIKWSEQQYTKKGENDEEGALPMPPKDIGQNYFNLPPPQMMPPPFMPMRGPVPPGGGNISMRPPFAKDLNARPSEPLSTPCRARAIKRRRCSYEKTFPPLKIRNPSLALELKERITNDSRPFGTKQPTCINESFKTNGTLNIPNFDEIPPCIQAHNENQNVRRKNRGRKRK